MPPGAFCEKSDSNLGSDLNQWNSDYKKKIEVDSESTSIWNPCYTCYEKVSAWVVLQWMLWRVHHKDILLLSPKFQTMSRSLSSHMCFSDLVAYMWPLNVFYLWHHWTDLPSRCILPMIANHDRSWLALNLPVCFDDRACMSKIWTLKFVNFHCQNDWFIQHFFFKNLAFQRHGYPWTSINDNDPFVWVCGWQYKKNTWKVLFCLHLFSLSTTLGGPSH